MNELAITRKLGSWRKCGRSPEIYMDAIQTAITIGRERSNAVSGVGIATYPGRGPLFSESTEVGRKRQGNRDWVRYNSTTPEFLPKIGTGDSGEGRDNQSPENRNPNTKDTDNTNWRERLFRWFFTFGWSVTPEEIFEPSAETRDQIRYIHSVRRRLDFVPTGHPLTDLIRGVTEDE